MAPPKRKSSSASGSASASALPPFPYSTTSSPSSSTPQPHAAADDKKSNMSPPTSTKISLKGLNKTKLPVVLKLSPKLLAQFPHEAPTAKVKPETASSTPPSTSAATPAKETPAVVEDVKPTPSETPVPAAATPNGADSNATGTPQPNGMLAPPNNGAAKRKGVPGPKPGMKRTASQLDVNGAPKPRGKPGPKKKARIGENGEALPIPTTAAPKLGPKANAGAINACLRALDRTGTPCRKWTKRSFAVRSFTGYSWGAGAYAARRKIGADGSFPGDVTSDTSSTGDKTQEVLGSGVQSEKSSQEVDTPMGGSAAVGTPVAAAS